MRTEHAASARRRETFVAKAGQFERQWKIVDAEGIPLGRLAADIAVVLMGKHRPEYTPHVDTGDFAIVTNARGVTLTGRKLSQKMRTKYSGYPGGLKTTAYGELLEKRPEFVIEESVRRMLPKGRLGRQMLAKLKVYAGADHPHQAQQPEPLSL